VIDRIDLKGALFDARARIGRTEVAADIEFDMVEATEDLELINPETTHG
jgi:hypothetical protein